MSKATFISNKEAAQADNEYGQYLDIINGVPGRNLLNQTINTLTSLPSEESVSKQVRDIFKQECGAWSRAKKHL
jgi:hypothetical protein